MSNAEMPMVRVSAFAAFMHKIRNGFAEDNRGIAAIEFAFIFPFFLILVCGVAEVGRALYQAQTLDKAIRVGALYAAHQPDPFSASVSTTVENLVKTGDFAGAAPLLLPGFADAVAKVEVTPLSYDLAGTPVPVIKVTASVPYVPIFPLVYRFFDSSTISLSLSHEQAYIGA